MRFLKNSQFRTLTEDWILPIKHLLLCSSFLLLFQITVLNVPQLLRNLYAIIVHYLHRNCKHFPIFFLFSTIVTILQFLNCTFPRQNQISLTFEIFFYRMKFRKTSFLKHYNARNEWKLWQLQ